MEGPPHASLATRSTQRRRASATSTFFSSSSSSSSSSSFLAQEVFAQVEASKEMIAMTKARKGHAPVPLTIDQPRTLQATVHIPIGTEGNLEQWIAGIMQKLASDSLIPLKKAEGEYGLGLREWRPIYDAEGSWTEKVLVQCTDEVELMRLHGTMHGKRINIGGYSAAVDVKSIFAELSR